MLLVLMMSKLMELLYSIHILPILEEIVPNSLHVVYINFINHLVMCTISDLDVYGVLTISCRREGGQANMPQDEF